ncbi:MAG TPA: hypothetical protein V6D29_13215 [Leptolyngbyaceae cyanobacterium]
MSEVENVRDELERTLEFHALLHGDFQFVLILGGRFEIWLSGTEPLGNPSFHGSLWTLPKLIQDRIQREAGSSPSPAHLFRFTPKNRIDMYPPCDSLGFAWGLEGKAGFKPLDPEHLPPDEDPEEAQHCFYVLSPEELTPFYL